MIDRTARQCRLFMICFAAVLLSSCSVSPRFRSGGNGGAPQGTYTAGTEVDGMARIQEGIASWYGDPYDGRATASGETYDMDKMTAAHRFLPFGTRIKVTNLRNDRSIELVVNDRGPFLKGRILDVSRKAAEELDFMIAGTAPVRIEVLAYGAGRR